MRSAKRVPCMPPQPAQRLSTTRPLALHGELAIEGTRPSRCPWSDSGRNPRTSSVSPRTRTLERSSQQFGYTSYRTLVRGADARHLLVHSPNRDPCTATPVLRNEPEGPNPKVQSTEQPHRDSPNPPTRRMRPDSPLRDPKGSSPVGCGKNRLLVSQNNISLAMSC